MANAQVTQEAPQVETVDVLAREERVPFDELVFARYEAMQARAAGLPVTQQEAKLRRVRRAFQFAEGRIVESFWGAVAPSGIALTRKRRLLGLLGSRTKFHRWTELCTQQYPQAAAELYRGDNLAHRCEEVLRGSTQRIGLGRIFGAMSSLLSFIEVQHSERRMESLRASTQDESIEFAAHERAGQLDQAIRAYRADLDDAASYYQHSAARAAHIFFFFGMLLGVVVIAALTTAGVFVVNLLLDRYGIGVSSYTYALAIGTVSAGALGACVSVMWRMSSGAFESDYEAGSGHIRMLGSFRPFIGAIFGLALYFAIQAGILPFDQAATFYSYAFIAFLGGFSERFAPDVFGGVTRSLQAAPSNDKLAGAGHDPASVLPSGAWRSSPDP